MAFLRRRSKTERTHTALPAVRTGPVAELKIEGQRLEHICRATLQITCACGYEGTLPVRTLIERYPRKTRISEALGSVRCSRCQHAQIQSVKALN